MKSVWILESGEDYEGGSIWGIYSNKPSREELSKVLKDYSGRVFWGIIDDVLSGKVGHVGCDWYSLTEREIIINDL